MIKNLKKILIIMIFTLLSMSINVKASTTNTTIVGEDECTKGDVITLEVKVQGTEKGLIGAQGKISYDKEVLEYKSCEIVASGWKHLTFNENTGIYLAEIETIGDEKAFVKTETAILRFKFQVKETTKTNTTVSIDEIIYTDSEYQTIDSGNVSKTIKIVEKDNDGNNNNDNENNTNNNGNTNNNTSNNVNNNQTTNTKPGNTNNQNVSDKVLPNSGMSRNIIIIAIILSIVGIFSCIKYSRYKGIK